MNDDADFILDDDDSGATATGMLTGWESVVFELDDGEEAET